MTQTGAARIGKYELLEFLGGGMSQVYRAADTVLGRTVVLKILADPGCAQPDARIRFLAEARLVSKLSQNFVVGIYDLAEDKEHGPYMVMEYLSGQDLRSAIDKGQIGGLKGKIRIALQVARALQYIHSQRVIHRDVKPENVFLTLTGEAKLMDFGIAKMPLANLTAAGFVLGTPVYMAPEQVMGKELTQQVDVYSFGVLLFELVTGIKPVAGATLERIFHTILNEPMDLTPLDSSGAPAALRDLIARCTAKDPSFRPAGFESICACLEAIAGSAEPAAAAPSTSRPDLLEPILTKVLSILSKVLPHHRRLSACFAALACLFTGSSGLAWRAHHRVESHIRYTADLVPAAGVAVDGLAGSESLRRLARLREYQDSLQPGRLSGSLRFSTVLYGDFYSSAHRVYFQHFQKALLGPAQAHILRYLRNLEDDGGSAREKVDEALKVYLATTSQSSNVDASFLVPALVRWWSMGQAPGQEREQAARREFEYYVRELQVANPLPAKYDSEAVARARRYLDKGVDLGRASAYTASN
jgi:serine/threonine protein kinase